MKLIKVGRDIIIGKGFAAKHWSGPVLFGHDQVLLCPNATHAQVVAGHDSGAAAGAMFGAIGGALADAASSKAAPSWPEKVVMIRDLPPAVTEADGWTQRRGKLPVLMIPRDEITEVAFTRGRITFVAFGDSFKLGLGMFGKQKTLAALREIGWKIT